MLGRDPKDDSVFSWTEHAKFKMRYYGLSASRVKNVVRRPKRTEEAVLEGAAAAMQPASSPGKKASEIWVMYVPIRVKAPFGLGFKRKIKIITAWRYPGASPKRGPVPIPPEILAEVKRLFR